MAWKVDFGSGEQEIGGYDLKLLAESGKINRKTKVYSTTKQKWCEAGEIAGLVFAADEDFGFGVQPDFCIDIPFECESPPSFASVQQQETAIIPKEKKTPRKVGFLDFSFDHLVTPLLISWTWIFLLIGATAGAIAHAIVHVRALAIAGPDLSEQTYHLNQCVIAFCSWIVSIFFGRVVLECVAVFFKIAAHLKTLADKE